MKDALGHGSDAGAHSGQIQKLPKLSRAHFEQIAAGLKAQFNGDEVAHSARISAAADQLQGTNPGFRRDLFLKAASAHNDTYRNKSTRAITARNTKTRASKVLSRL